MRKYLGYAILGLVVLGGFAYLTVLSLQPRKLPKITLTTFENPAAISNSILRELRSEMQGSPILVWGLETGDPALRETFERFLENNQDPTTKYEIVLVDTALEGLEPELAKIQGERLNANEETARLIQGLQAAQAQNRRVLVVMPVVYAAAYLSHSVANKIKAAGLPVMSVLTTNFSRRREQEIETRLPCNTNVNDKDGSGKLGCEIVQTARVNYRKKMESGKLVGLMNQISTDDFLFLLAREP